MSNIGRNSERLHTSREAPLRAVLPVSSLLRGYTRLPGGSYFGGSAFSPPLRHISPDEHLAAGHRSPGASNYKGKSLARPLEPCIRRTASLDALTMPRPVWSTVQAHPSCLLLHIEKATQTDESYCQEMIGRSAADILRSETPTEGVKIEKIFRPRLQQRSHSQRSTEHSVSAQTQSSHPGAAAAMRASPVTIPPRAGGAPGHLRPMRSSVEGLNQEIEKLVLIPGQPHTCRPESNRNLFSRGTPDGHRAPIAELLHGDMRSVNTQTPLGDIFVSSDDSQSTSPDESVGHGGGGGGAGSYRAPPGGITNASPRINKFLAREPPDGCEKVNLRPTESSEQTTIFKPCFVGGLRPSLGSAFQPLQPLSPSSEEAPATPPPKE